MLEGQKSLLNKVIAAKDVVLFGAGGYAKPMIGVINTLGPIRIVGLFDNDSRKYGTSIEGIEVSKLADLNTLSKEVSIIITTSVSEFIKDILNQLKNLGFMNVYYFPFYFFLEHKKGILQHDMNTDASKIAKLHSLLHDQESKDTLSAVLEYRSTFDFHHILPYARPLKDQYFDEVIQLGPDECIVDAGAYDGDSLASFVERTHGQFEAIYAFEPDTTNFNKLKKNKLVELYQEKIIIENKGLYDKTEKVYFSSTQGDDLLGGQKGMASHIKGEGPIEGNSGLSELITVELTYDFINVTSVDEYFIDKKVTFIKMDIEGAEIKALQGAIKTIQKYKPKLAICIYHNPKDLWEIPLLIKDICPDYKLFIRHYECNLWDTVVYAI